MNYMIPLVYFILANGFIVFVSKKSFGKCLPLTMMGSAFVYFFSQVLFKTFKIGFCFNILIAILFILLIIYSLIKKKDLNKFKENFFSKGFYAFIVLFLLVLFLDYNRTFSSWDELSHWGMMVKEMFRLDKFYSVAESISTTHKDYPPIMQLFELFYNKLCGSYSETALIMSLHLFEFSLFIPAICDSDKFKKGNTLIKSVCLFISAYSIVLLLDQHGVINSIYIDYVMAILTAYLLVNVIINKEPLSAFSIISMCVGLSFLVLTKQVAITLYAMVLFLFVIDLIIRIHYDKNKNKLTAKKVIILFVCLLCIPLGIYKGWNIYIQKLEINGQFNTADINLYQLKGIMSGTDGEDYQIQASTNYVNAIKSNSMTTSSLISLNYIQCLVLSLLLIYLLHIVGRKYFYKFQLHSLSLTIIIGFIGYAFVMLCLYVFCFGSVEGPNLASFNRYLPTYILVVFALILMLYTHVDTENDHENKIIKYAIIVTCLLLLVQNPSKIEKYLPDLKNDSYYTYQEQTNVINSKTEEDSKIFLVTQKSGRYFFRYYLHPRVVNDEYSGLKYTEQYSSAKEFFNEEVKEYMSDYDYLYIASINDDFIDEWGFLFDNDNIEVRQLYKISTDNGNIALTLVE